MIPPTSSLQNTNSSSSCGADEPAFPESVPAAGRPDGGIALTHNTDGAAWRIPHCPVPIIVALLMGIVLRVGWLGDKPLWEDEAWTFVTAVADEPLRELVGADPHPYSFYWLCRQWPDALLASDFTFRLPLALAACLALALFPLVVKRLNVSPALAGWGVLTFALLPLNVRYAQEARAYAFCQLAGILVLLAYVGFLHRPRRSIMLGLFAATALSMHIDGFGWITPFIVALHALSTGVRKVAPRRALVTIIAGALAATPYIVFRARMMFAAGDMHTVGSGRLLKAFGGRWLELSPLGVAFEAAPGALHAAVWFFAILAATVFIIGAATRDPGCNGRPRLPALLFFVPFAGLLAMSVATGQILIFKKYLVPLAPAVAVLFPLGVFRIVRGRRLVGIILLCIAPLTVSLASNIRAGSRADWRGLYRELRPDLHSGDTFVQQRHLNYPMYSFGPFRAYAWRDGLTPDDAQFIEFAVATEPPADRANEMQPLAPETLERIMRPRDDGAAHVWTFTTHWMADDRMPDLTPIATPVSQYKARFVRAVRWRLTHDSVPRKLSPGD